jgi:hypothetical protein
VAAPIGAGLAVLAGKNGSLFATASGWVARLTDAHHAGRLQDAWGQFSRAVDTERPSRYDC